MRNLLGGGQQGEEVALESVLFFDDDANNVKLAAAAGFKNSVRTAVYASSTLA